MTHRWILTASLVTLLATACTDSHSEGEDAAIVFELPPDAGYDAGPLASVPVGIACLSDTDCGSEVGVCLQPSDGFADGYCTAVCEMEGECPSGSVCVFSHGSPTGYCLDSCDPAATERECRQYYGCASGFGIIDPICLPGCTDDTDCDVDRMCNPAGGGRCYNPSAAFGDACASFDACADGQFCRSEERGGSPGGICTVFGCDPAANTGCPDDGQCIPRGDGSFGICFDGCETAEDCRAGWDCGLADETLVDRQVCIPACTSSDQCNAGYTCNVDTGGCE